MRKRRFVVGVDCKRLLEEAIEKRLPVTVTRKCDDNWQVYKSNLLYMDSNRIVMALPTPPVTGVPIEPVPGQEMAITFKKGYNKCLFVTRVISQDQFELEPGLTVQSVVLYRPEQIEKIKRRAYNRTEPPAGTIVPAIVWPCDDPACKIFSQLTNLSAGGIGLTVPPAGTVLEGVRDCAEGCVAEPVSITIENIDQAVFQENQQYEIFFFPFPHQDVGNQVGSVRVQARLRHVSGSGDGSTLLGFQMVGLELSEEGRSVLRRISRIVSMYERQKPIAEHTNLHAWHDVS